MYWANLSTDTVNQAAVTKPNGLPEDNHKSKVVKCGKRVGIMFPSDLENIPSKKF